MLRLALLLMVLTACGTPQVAQLATNNTVVLPVYLGTTQTPNVYFVAIAAPNQFDRLSLCAQTADCTQTQNLITLQKTRSNKTAFQIFTLQQGLQITRDINYRVIAHATDGTTTQRVVAFKSKAADNSNLAPPANLAAPRAVPNVEIAFDYPGTLTRTSANAIVVRMVVQSGGLKGKSQARLVAQLRNLKNSQATTPIDHTVGIDANGIIDFPIKGLEPETTYRLDNIVLSDPQNSALASKVKAQFHGITGGSTQLGLSRRLVTMRAVSEAYDWAQNNYDSSKRYNLGAPGGWCDQFYSWAGNGILTLQYPKYSPPWYERNKAMGSSSNLKEVAAREAVHGDLLMQASHSFMILAVDSSADVVWTVEGNFNNRVMYHRRSLSSGWRHGHLNDKMINATPTLQ